MSLRSINESFERLSESVKKENKHRGNRSNHALNEKIIKRKKLKESEKEPTIKRYSDVRPRSERKYWYFTKHGVQPGSIPNDLHVLETRDGKNDSGEFGTYVMLDGVLNTSELKKYDMRELAPKEESEKRRMRPQGERTTVRESLKNKKKNNSLKEDYVTDLVAEILSGKVKKPSYKVFKWKSNNGDSGEVTYRGVDYAFRKLPNGDYKVMRSSDAGWNWSETLFKESKLRKTRKSLKESKKLTESFDDMEVFMNTWANYNEYGADSGITPTGWMSIDDAIEYCEEYAEYEPFINDTDNVPFDDVNEYSNASSVLQELKELQESDVDEDVVEAIAEAGGYDIKEAVEIAERGDYYWYPGLSSYTDLAYEVIDEIGGLKEALGDRITDYIDEDQMRREYSWDIREIMRDTAEQEVDDAHEGEDEDSYDREQEIEDWMDEHEDEYLDMIIDEDIRLAEAGEIDLSNYFDYEAYGRDLSFDGYTLVDGGIILIL